MSYTSVQSQGLPEQTVSRFLFVLYVYFVIDFFLHLSARVPGYGVIRPTLLLAVIITFILILQKERLPRISNESMFKHILWLITFVIITLPLVTWPGSVLMTNIPVFIKAVVFFFFTAFIIDTEKRLSIFLFVFCACQVFRVLEPLYLHITDGYWGDKTHLGGGEFAQRLSGAPADVVNPNGLGFVIVTVIPFLHYLLWRSRKIVYKFVYILLLPAMLYALVLTMSRGAFVALLIIVWMIFKQSEFKFWMIIALVIAVIYGWSNMSDVHKDRYLSLVTTESNQAATAEGRIQGMFDEFIVATERPIIGHGLGTSREAKARAGIGWMISHNLYAEVLIEIGVIGFIIYFFFLLSIYKKYRENLMKLKSSIDVDSGQFTWRLNATLGAVFWMYAIYSINYFGLSVYYWYMFAGLTLAFSRIYFLDEGGNV